MPRIIASTRPVTPELICTTLPPAKSTESRYSPVPNKPEPPSTYAPINPPPQTIWARG